jgi:hypothetical protein
MNSDPIDRAADTTDFLTDAAIRNIRANVQKGLKPTGFCYFCESDVNSNMLFCDAGCAQDYEHEQKMRRISGGR